MAQYAHKSVYDFPPDRTRLRRRFLLPQMPNFDLELPRQLKNVVEAWKQLRILQGDVPRYLPIETIREIGLHKNMHLVDCSHDNPQEARWLSWGANSVIFGGLNPQAVNVKVIDGPWTDYAQWAVDEYYTVKYTIRPRVDYVETDTLTERTFRYRVLLPFTNDEGLIDRIVSFWVFSRPFVVLGPDGEPARSIGRLETWPRTAVQ